MEIDGGSEKPAPSTRLVPHVEKSKQKKSRVAAHSHVKGLGLNSETGEAELKAGGFVGQCAAREACGMVVELVRNKKLAGRAVLLAGPPGTGKTAMAVAMAQELGDQVPFCLTVGSEVFSSEVKKTEMLMEAVRKSIGIRLRERKELYEGEVTQIEPVEVENPIAAYGGKALSRVMVTLKTDKGTRTLRLDPSIYDQLLKQRVAVGDVIYIEATSGTVKRTGRCDLYATENDIETDEWVPMPKGEVHKTKELVQHATLYDFDKAGASQRDSKALSLLTEVMGHRKTEITTRLRQEVDKAINQYIQEGQAELIPGVLFIDEVHMLDLECFTFLHRVLESEVSPIVVMATNRGPGVVRGSNGDQGEEQPHSIPSDLLDRLLIIRTFPQGRDDTLEILKVRARAEEVRLSEEALHHLCDIAQQRGSLRYAIQLMTPAKILSQTVCREEVTKGEIQQCEELFIDARTSAKLLASAKEASAGRNVGRSAGPGSDWSLPGISGEDDEKMESS